MLYRFNRKRTICNLGMTIIIVLIIIIIFLVAIYIIRTQIAPTLFLSNPKTNVENNTADNPQSTYGAKNSKNNMKLSDSSSKYTSKASNSINRAISSAGSTQSMTGMSTYEVLDESTGKVRYRTDYYSPNTTEHSRYGLDRAKLCSNIVDCDKFGQDYVCKCLDPPLCLVGKCVRMV